MANKNIIVIGSSLGGIEALKILVGELPGNMEASIFVVQHISPHHQSYLPEILANRGSLTATHAKDREPIRQGHIYVAPPDHHLLIEENFIRVTRGPKENRFRPSADALFRSAAYVYGPRVVGVVLTGLLDDGTTGLWAVKDRGGTAIVQDPTDAVAASIPSSALNQVEVDYCLPLLEIPRVLADLSQTQASNEGEYSVSEQMKIEVGIAKEDAAIDKGLLNLFEPSLYSCPDCRGVLLQVKEGNSIRFRCHTGHAFSRGTISAALDAEVEDRLDEALRALDERATLSRSLAAAARAAGHPEAEATHENEAAHAAQRAALIDATRSMPSGAPSDRTP
jgi:two-component system chemotaxis response regulator CheB